MLSLLAPVRHLLPDLPEVEEMIAVLPFGSKLYGTDCPGTSDTDLKVVYWPSSFVWLFPKSFHPIFKVKIQTEGVDAPVVTRNPQAPVNGGYELEFIPLHTFLWDFFLGRNYATESGFGLISASVLVLPSRSASLDYSTKKVEMLRDTLGEINSLWPGVSRIKPLVGYALNTNRASKDLNRERQAFEKVFEVLKNQMALGTYHPGKSIKEWIEQPEGEALFSQSSDIFIKEVEAFNKGPESFLVVAGTSYPLNAKIANVSSTAIRICKPGFGSNPVQKGEEDKELYHTLRLLLQVREYLEEGKIGFPLKEAPYIRKVRAGSLPVEEVISRINAERAWVTAALSIAPADEEWDFLKIQKFIIQATKQIRGQK